MTWGINTYPQSFALAASLSRLAMRCLCLFGSLLWWQRHVVKLEDQKKMPRLNRDAEMLVWAKLSTPLSLLI